MSKPFLRVSVSKVSGQVLSLPRRRTPVNTTDKITKIAKITKIPMIAKMAKVTKIAVIY